jgi:F0F1-type ATP synthase assembly protein I
MNKEVEPKPLDIEGFGTKKFDFEEFDPKPLEPEDLEGIPSDLGVLTREKLEIETPKPKSPKKEKSQEEQLSALRSALTAFSLVGQIGLVMFASVAIGLFGGMYLDRWLGTGPILLIILTIVGVASGFRAIYLMIKRFI